MDIQRIQTNSKENSIQTITQLTRQQKNGKINKTPKITNLSLFPSFDTESLSSLNSNVKYAYGHVHVESCETSVESALEAGREKVRKHFLKYTRQAFQVLPKIKEPTILDVGCGSGNPTIELAKLSGGNITGIDVDQNSLDKLNKKIQHEGFGNRVFTKKCSLLDIGFPDETFDIIWAEGSIHIVGFEKGLRELRRLLRQDGFIVVHDGIKDVSTKLKKVPDFGYKFVNQFKLPDDAWWVHYFEPLERLIKEQREKAKTNKDLRVLARYQNEVNMFKTNPKENVSAVYIFQKSTKEKD